MIKWSIYQKAVTSKNIYASNIRYLRKMKQTLRERKTEIVAQEQYDISMSKLNRHVQITRPNKSIKHGHLKDTQNILYETPQVRPKSTILRDCYHESIERVTGRKARGLQKEEGASKCQTFFSVLSGRRKQTSDIFSFSIQI